MIKMKQIIKLNENDLKLLITESLNSLKNNKTLYTQVTFKHCNTINDILYILDDTLTNGLRCNNNGEDNGIWFSNGDYFYGIPHGIQLALSLTCNEDDIDKYGFDEYDFSNNSSILVAHKDIPINDLNIEYSPIFLKKVDDDIKLICGDINSYKFYSHYNNLIPIERGIKALLKNNI